MGPVLCMITDRRRHGLSWRTTLPAQVAAAAHAGVQLVQVREPDLAGGELLALVQACVQAARGTPARILVNDRVDVALAGAAHGVHLPGMSVTARTVRDVTGHPFLLGRSVHSVDEAAQASNEGGLDYLVVGTIFQSVSKPGRTPAGLALLKTVAASVSLPVLAVGGLSLERLAQVAHAGATGGAAIDLFASCPADDLGALVSRMGAAFDTPRDAP